MNTAAAILAALRRPAVARALLLGAMVTLAAAVLFLAAAAILTPAPAGTLPPGYLFRYLSGGTQ